MLPLKSIIAATDGSEALDLTKILLIRHGQSLANVAGIFAGFSDSPLSDLGQHQAELTAAYIGKHYQVDAVYASDLKRAFETGKDVADRFGLTVSAGPAFREINGGDWEGIPYAKLPDLFPDTFGCWLSDIGNAICDGGESVAQLQKRVVDALLLLCRENPGKTIVIATHATPIRTLQCYCEGKSLSQMKDVPWVSNASVTELAYDGKDLRITSLSYDEHLGELKTTLPKTC